MSNYNKATNFAVKDTLTSGDPDKVVSGAEIDNEFNSIASAVSSKADKVSAATTDNFAALDANGNLKDSGVGASIADGIVPSGGIIMWSGGIATIPSGFVICDGNNGTPDLRNRFIVGAGDTYVPDDTGGSNSVTLTESEMPSHNHTESQGSGLGNRFGTISTGFSERKEGFGSPPLTSAAPLTSTEGGDQAHENRPPYYALAFIMKT